MGFFSTIGTLIMVGLILFFAWWCTKRLAMGTQGAMQSRYMKLLDRIPVSQDKSIILVQVGEKYYVLGVASSAINVLAELDKEEMIPFEPSAAESMIAGMNFKELLQKIGGKERDGE